MQNMGCPILGDDKYGKPNLAWQNKNEIALSATAISFKTATDNKEINLEIPLPEGWKKYL